MVRNDEEITKFVLKNCGTQFSEEFIRKLNTNSQTSRLTTKYEMLEEEIIEQNKIRGIQCTQDQIDICASKAYIYAKLVSGKFLDIRPRVDSSDVLKYIIANYEDGYKYMQEAIFMKLGLNSMSSYVKGKLEGHSFFTKIAGVTNSQPSEIKKTINVSSTEVNKIKNLIFQIRAKEDEYRWVNSRIERMSYQNINYIQKKKMVKIEG